MLRKLLIAALLAAGLAGCVSANQSDTSPGMFNGFGSDTAPKLVIGSANGVITDDQRTIALAAAQMNSKNVDDQLSSPLEAEGTGALHYGPGYCAGNALQSIKFGPGVAGVSCLTGLGTGIAGGFVYGEVIWSQANVTANAALTNKTLDSWSRGWGIPAKLAAYFGSNDRVMKLSQITFVAPALVRSTNRTPTGLPDFREPTPQKPAVTH